MTYTVRNMHGPTVLGSEDREKALDTARRAAGPTAGPYRVFDPSGQIIAHFENHEDILGRPEQRSFVVTVSERRICEYVVLADSEAEARSKARTAHHRGARPNASEGNVDVTRVKEQPAR